MKYIVYFVIERSYNIKIYFTYHSKITREKGDKMVILSYYYENVTHIQTKSHYRIQDNKYIEILY